MEDKLKCGISISEADISTKQKKRAHHTASTSRAFLYSYVFPTHIIRQLASWSWTKPVGRDLV
jgi:hypothetical protein